MGKKKLSIKKYIKILLAYLDGNGITVIDEKLINKSLDDCGDFLTLQEIIKEG